MCIDLVWHLLGRAVGQVWVLPRLHFKYYGFEWVATWPGDGMYWHFAALAVLALCVAAGFYYRVSTVLLCLGFTHIFLAEKGAFQNHFYLLCLLSLLMIFLPAHRAFSIDALRGRVAHSATAPVWTLWLLRGQVALVYFYGGVAKLNADWLQGEPMRLWLKGYSDYWLIGPYVQEEWLVGFFTYGGLLLDLFIAPLLLWPLTRPYAFALGQTFHVLNHWIFRIGIFPWFMLGANLLFFAPDWPRRLWARLRQVPYTPVAAPPLAPASPDRRRTVALALLAVYTTIQILAPLRHLLYPGNTSWTEQGHRFAWRMMLRDKKVHAELIMRDPRSGVSFAVDLERYLAPWQRRVIVNDPDMILQLCRYLKEEKRRQGYADYEVYAHINVSLNGRPPQLMLDPSVDLASQSRTLLPAPWIKRLTVPLPAR